MRALLVVELLVWQVESFSSLDRDFQTDPSRAFISVKNYFYENLVGRFVRALVENTANSLAQNFTREWTSFDVRETVERLLLHDCHLGYEGTSSLQVREEP